MENNRKLLNAKEVAELRGISNSYAYQVIDKLNGELEKAGYLTISGKVDSLYLIKRYFPCEEKIQNKQKGETYATIQIPCKTRREMDV